MWKNQWHNDLVVEGQQMFTGAAATRKCFNPYITVRLQSGIFGAAASSHNSQNAPHGQARLILPSLASWAVMAPKRLARVRLTSET